MDITLTYTLTSGPAGSRAVVFTKELHNAQVPLVGDLVAVARQRYRVAERTWHDELRRVSITVVDTPLTRDLPTGVKAHALHADRWLRHDRLVEDLAVLTEEPVNAPG